MQIKYKYCRLSKFVLSIHRCIVPCLKKVKLCSSYYCTIRFFRGYLPYGKGSVVVRSNPVQYLDNVEMVDPGVVTKITGRAFVAGGKPVKVKLK